MQIIDITITRAYLLNPPVMSAATAPSALRGRDDVLGAFDGFRQHLDEHHDRRERLIKVLTIFLLCHKFTH